MKWFRQASDLPVPVPVHCIIHVRIYSIATVPYEHVRVRCIQSMCSCSYPNLHIHTVWLQKREQKYCGCKATTFTVLLGTF